MNTRKDSSVTDIIRKLEVPTLGEKQDLKEKQELLSYPSDKETTLGGLSARRFYTDEVEGIFPQTLAPNRNYRYAPYSDLFISNVTLTRRMMIGFGVQVGLEEYRLNYTINGERKSLFCRIDPMSFENDYLMTYVLDAFSRNLATDIRNHLPPAERQE